MKNFFCIGLAVLAVFTVSCRETEFLHHVVPVPAQVTTMTSRIRDIVPATDVDILWVIDDSGSMATHQNAVRTNLSSFMRDFTRTQMRWKMGLISSTSTRLPVIGLAPGDVLDWSVSNGIARFATAVGRLGTGGSGVEQFFAPVLDKVQDYPDFTRPGVPLVVIFVTDAPEQSSWQAQYFLDQMHAALGPKRSLAIYGAFSARDLGCPITDDGWDYSQSVFREAIEATHGSYFKLCSRDFGEQLALLGQQISQRISQSRIYLSGRPRLGTLTVKYRGAPLMSGLPENGGIWVYDYDLNAVIFHNLDFSTGDTDDVEISFEQDSGIDPVRPEV